MNGQIEYISTKLNVAKYVKLYLVLFKMHGLY